MFILFHLNIGCVIFCDTFSNSTKVLNFRNNVYMYIYSCLVIFILVCSRMVRYLYSSWHWDIYSDIIYSPFPALASLRSDSHTMRWQTRVYLILEEKISLIWFDSHKGDGSLVEHAKSLWAFLFSLYPFSFVNKHIFYYLLLPTIVTKFVTKQ